MNEGTKESCYCEKCKSACRYKPGWFLPSQAEQVAIHLGIPLQDLFKTRLAVDWWTATPIFVLSPALVGKDTGTEFPRDPRGTCVFFKKGLCEIHPVKPFECRETIHNETPDGLHKQVADAWKSHQDQIVEFLGRQPVSASFGMFDLFAL